MSEKPKNEETDVPETREQFYANRRGKNLAILGCIVAFFVLFYLITILRMS